MKRNSSPVLMLLLVFIAGCAMGEPLPEDYYAGIEKIGGGNPPLVPVLSFNAGALRFDFTQSIDPETGSEVGTYFCYIYNGVPSTYYAVRDIALAISPPSQRTFFYTGEQSGTKTAVVTGFDGYRESAVTEQNRVTFSFP